MIRIEHLNFSYNRRGDLFESLDLSLESGNIYGLLGKNGAGKSTLLKLISGTLFPNKGSLEVMGYSPSQRFPQLTREISLITEEFYLPPYKIKRYADLFSPFYPRFSFDLFHTYLEEFTLTGEQYLSNLSYGQKKKFLLAFGLATDCKLFIMDEPTNGLDIPSKSQFRKVLASAIHRDRSFIVSTHQVKDIENLIDPLIILDEGKVVFYEDFERISSKLKIEKKSEVVEDEDLIYAEEIFGGYTVVSRNRGDTETSLNLETLFNAVVNSGKKINQLFNKE